MCIRDRGASNAIGWLVQADHHRLTKLRGMAMRYVKQNFRRIRMVAKDSLRLLAQEPDLSVEVMSCI